MLVLFLSPKGLIHTVSRTLKILETEVNQPGWLTPPQSSTLLLVYKKETW